MYEARVVLKSFENDSGISKDLSKSYLLCIKHRSAFRLQSVRIVLFEKFRLDMLGHLNFQLCGSVVLGFTTSEINY